MLKRAQRRGFIIRINCKIIKQPSLEGNSWYTWTAEPFQQDCSLITQTLPSTGLSGCVVPGAGIALVKLCTFLAFPFFQPVQSSL